MQLSAQRHFEANVQTGHDFGVSAATGQKIMGTCTGFQSITGLTLTETDNHAQ